MSTIRPFSTSINDTVTTIIKSLEVQAEQPFPQDTVADTLPGLDILIDILQQYGAAQLAELNIANTNEVKDEGFELKNNSLHSTAKFTPPLPVSPHAVPNFMPPPS